MRSKIQFRSRGTGTPQPRRMPPSLLYSHIHAYVRYSNVQHTLALEVSMQRKKTCSESKLHTYGLSLHCHHGRKHVLGLNLPVALSEHSKGYNMAVTATMLLASRVIQGEKLFTSRCPCAGRIRNRFVPPPGDTQATSARAQARRTDV